MAVTLGSSGITYSDGTTSTTRAGVLGAVQYTAYVQYTARAFQTFSTTLVDGFVDLADASGSVLAISSASSVLCGFQVYRSGVTAAGPAPTDDARTADAGILQRRLVYRTIG